MARYGSLPTSTPAAAPAAAPAAPAKPATPATQTAPAAPARPAKPKTPALKTPKSPYSAESEEIFGSKPGTLGPAGGSEFTDADIDFYLKKLEDVQALRKQGVLGQETRRPFVGTGSAGEMRTYGTPGRTVIRSVETPMMVSLRAGEAAQPVMPDPRYVYTPGSEMDSIARFRELALELGKSYRDDAEAVRRGSEDLARAGRDPYLNRSLLRGMEQDQLQKIRRLAASRASLREMGFMDDQEVQEKFLK